MDDRRAPTFTFTSEAALIAFFSSSLPKARIKEIIASLSRDFKPREGEAEKDTRLQWLKKCECEIVRQIRAAQTSA